MNITFLGGSFDPPHLGHYKIAEFFKNKCDLFLFIPAKKSPFKTLNPHVSSIHRIEMLKLLTRKLPNIEIETFEINNSIDSFTYLTVEYILKKYKPTQLNMVIGADHIQKLESWENFKFIYENCKIFCFNREDTSFNKNLNIQFVKNFNIPVSSSQIRNEIKNNNIELLENNLDKSILYYIKKNKLYI